jgi:hypothetical protein
VVTELNWQGLMQKWNQAAILANQSLPEERRVAEISNHEWLGYPGATDEQIAQSEIHLGATFPPSYRSFLKVTNGWQYLDFSIYRLWSTEEVDWFSVRNQEWIDTCIEYADSSPISDEEYFVYDTDRDQPMRTEYLQTALEISDVGNSAILLLNPQVISDEGEWECWMLATWIPGAYRHRSFWELMNTQYESFLQVWELPG